MAFQKLSTNFLSQPLKLAIWTICCTCLCLACIDESNQQEESLPAQEEESLPAQEEMLQGSWFRKIPQFVGLSATEVVERGEAHFRLTFSHDHKFLYHQIVLGIYEGTTLTDTSAWTKDIGTYIQEDNRISVDLDQYIWLDTFYPEMTEPEVREVDFNRKFRDVTYEIVGDSLIFNYHNLTLDGPELREEKYVRVLD